MRTNRSKQTCKSRGSFRSEECSDSGKSFKQPVYLTYFLPPLPDRISPTMRQIHRTPDSLSQISTTQRPARRRTHLSKLTRTWRPNRPLHQRPPLERRPLLRHLPGQRPRIKSSSRPESNNAINDDRTPRLNPRSPHPNQSKTPKHNRANRNFHATKRPLRSRLPFHAI